MHLSTVAHTHLQLLTATYSHAYLQLHTIAVTHGNIAICGHLTLAEIYNSAGILAFLLAHGNLNAIVQTTAYKTQLVSPLARFICEATMETTIRSCEFWINYTSRASCSHACKGNTWK